MGDHRKDEAEFLALLMPDAHDPADVAGFLATLRRWLRQRNDPRLVEGGDGSARIDNIVACAAEYCQYMAEVMARRERN